MPPIAERAVSTLERRVAASPAAKSLPGAIARLSERWLPAMSEDELALSKAAHERNADRVMERFWNRQGLGLPANEEWHVVDGRLQQGTVSDLAWAGPNVYRSTDLQGGVGGRVRHAIEGVRKYLQAFQG